MALESFELNRSRFQWCDCKQYPCIILDVSIKTMQCLMFINKYWPFLYHTRSNNIKHILTCEVYYLVDTFY